MNTQPPTPTLTAQIIDLLNSTEYMSPDGDSNKITTPNGLQLFLSHDEDDEQKLKITCKIPTQNQNDLIELDTNKFQIFEPLERLTGTSLSENFNSDAAAYSYHFDSGAGQGPVLISCKITDYLS